MEKMGIENLSKVVALIVESGNVADLVMKEAGAAAKAGHLLKLTDELMTMPGVEFSKLDDELKDLSEVEKAQLHEQIKAKFDLADDRVEAVIEGAIGIAMKAHSLVIESLALVASMKQQPEAA